MGEALGSFCLVLHGHLPYVLRHGIWPHGEDWLYEAAAETYLSLLAIIDECIFLNGKPKLAMGLPPVLLEQLAHCHLKTGFDHFLEDRIQRAKADRLDFERMNSGRMVKLAEWWIDTFTGLREQFDALGRDIPGAFAERGRSGFIEVLTSAATHGYMPLLYEDSSIRAQIRAGVFASERILGFKPRCMWLPECAYRPGGRWDPPVNWAPKERRIGLEHLMADEGITHFFVESHLIEASRSEQVFDDGQWWKVGWEEAAHYPNRGWRCVNEPNGVNSDGIDLSRMVVFARDSEVCERVWSGQVGYPAEGSIWSSTRNGAQNGVSVCDIGRCQPPDGPWPEASLSTPGRVEGKLREYASRFESLTALTEKVVARSEHLGRLNEVENRRSRMRISTM